MTVTWSGAAPALEQETTDHAESASALFERHRQRVHAFCRSRTRNAADADDATQTTFMYALSGLQRGVVPEFELAWLLRIAENVCHSMRRRAHRRYERDELPADLLDDRNRDPAVVSDRLSTIAEALEMLPETQRRAIILREWRGLSYEDIATQLGTSHAAVETLLFRARRSLAKRVASLGTPVLHLPQLVRWLLGSGAAKATAVTAAAIVLGAGLPSDVPASRADALDSRRHPAGAGYERGAEPPAARSAGLSASERRRTPSLSSASPATPPSDAPATPPSDAPATPRSAPVAAQAAAVALPTVGVDSAQPVPAAAEPPPPAVSGSPPRVEVRLPAREPLPATVDLDEPPAVTTVVEELVPPVVTDVVTEVEVVSEEVTDLAGEVTGVVPAVDLQVPTPLPLPVNAPAPIVPQLPAAKLP